MGGAILLVLTMTILSRRRRRAYVPPRNRDRRVVALLDPRFLHLPGPFRVRLEVGDHLQHRGAKLSHGTLEETVVGGQNGKQEISSGASDARGTDSSSTREGALPGRRGVARARLQVAVDDGMIDIER